MQHSLHMHSSQYKLFRHDSHVMIDNRYNGDCDGGDGCGNGLAAFFYDGSGGGLWDFFLRFSYDRNHPIEPPQCDCMSWDRNFNGV